MSEERHCDCCKQIWYVSNLVSGLCPNCLDFLATKNQMSIEQDQKIKELEAKLAEKVEFDKFKSAEELLKAYQNLEREFTKSRQRLAESKKELKKCNDEWTDICDGKLETINRLIEEKHELEEIITNNSHNKWLKAEAERYKNEYQSVKGYIEQLKQQLEKKEKEYQDLKEIDDATKESLYASRERIDEMKSKIWTLEKSQNQTVIEELEKVKEYWLKHEDIGYYVDQRIKSLKGEK